MDQMLWDFIECNWLCSVPAYLRNLLSHNGFDSIDAIKNICNDDIKHLEMFARSIDYARNIPKDADLREFFGTYHEAQDRFEILRGHKILLTEIVKYVSQPCTKRDFETFKSKQERVVKLNEEQDEKASLQNVTNGYIDADHDGIQHTSEVEKDDAIETVGGSFPIDSGASLSKSLLYVERVEDAARISKPEEVINYSVRDVAPLDLRVEKKVIDSISAIDNNELVPDEIETVREANSNVELKRLPNVEREEDAARMPKVYKHWLLSSDGRSWCENGKTLKICIKDFRKETTSRVKFLKKTTNNTKKKTIRKNELSNLSNLKFLFPCDLPNELLANIKKITEKKNFTFNKKNLDLLVEIDTAARAKGKSVHNQIFTYFETHFTYKKNTLLNRVKKLRIKKEKAIIKEFLMKLKTAVHKAISQLLSNNQLINNPQNKFKWTDELRDLMYEVIASLERSYDLKEPRGITMDFFVQQYLKEHVLKMWPDGWMTMENLTKFEERLERINCKSKAKETIMMSRNDMAGPSNVQFSESNVFPRNVRELDVEQELDKLQMSSNLTSPLEHSEEVSGTIQNECTSTSISKIPPFYGFASMFETPSPMCTVPIENLVSITVTPKTETDENEICNFIAEPFEKVTSPTPTGLQKQQQKQQQQQQPQPCLPPYQSQHIIATETRKSAKMLIVLQNGEQRLITFSLPKESWTVQELLQQVGVPFTAHTNIECVANPSVSIDYLVTVGVTCSSTPSEIISAAENTLQLKQQQHVTIGNVDSPQHIDKKQTTVSTEHLNSTQGSKDVVAAQQNGTSGYCSIRVKSVACLNNSVDKNPTTLSTETLTNSHNCIAPISLSQSIDMEDSTSDCDEVEFVTPLASLWRTYKSEKRCEKAMMELQPSKAEGAEEKERLAAVAKDEKRKLLIIMRKRALDHYYNTFEDGSSAKRCK